MQENEIEDATFEEVTEVTATPEVDEEKQKISFGDILSSLSAAIASGGISSQQARRIRADMGIRQSYFTRKQPKTNVRRAKRKAQKAARKLNRKKG